MMATSRWVSVEEIAQHLGVSEDTIYRWIEDKHIPAHRVGRRWRFKVEEVDKWVRSGKADDRPHAAKAHQKATERSSS